MMVKRNQAYMHYQPSRKTCGGKVCYAHKHEAEQAADEMMIIDPELELRVYKCLDCRGWHLTRARVDIA